MQRLIVSMADAREEAFLKRVLPSSFLAYAARYRNDGARLRTLNCLFLLYEHLKSGNIDPHTLSLCRMEGGKPFLDPCVLHFSYSHSGELIALLVSDVPCGVDVEAVRSARNTDRNTDRIIEKYFSIAEQEQYAASSDRALFFTALWTKKEAVGKCLGTGVFPHSLAALDVTHTQTCTLSYNGQRYCLSLALDKEASFKGSPELAEGISIFECFE
ncbi:MAG: 4'-phosphopantetheinyl transferase superfamily protein [Clostridia bacterium]|nr:4'-phosphopantetheinyl transferase superfamily protein [Clostridia bacterium]